MDSDLLKVLIISHGEFDSLKQYTTILANYLGWQSTGVADGCCDFDKSADSAMLYSIMFEKIT